MELNWRHIPQKLGKLHSPNIAKTKFTDYATKTDIENRQIETLQNFEYQEKEHWKWDKSDSNLWMWKKPYEKI